MSDQWSVDDVQALAPDASSWKAARKTSAPGVWPHAGILAGEAVVVWGECQGSGKSRYTAAAHMDGPDGPAYKCSCPSRKTPCKHVLGLLSRWAGGELEQTPQSPEWVTQWITRREARSVRKAEKAAPDPAQVEATRRKRDLAVAEGLAELSLWLRDQVDSGLADAPGRGYDHWDRMAKRLVDAKAGGAAELVSELPTLIKRVHDWPMRLLERLGQLHLLVEAHRSREHLPETLRAAVNDRLGVTVRSDEVLAEGERVTDTWTVLGRRQESNIVSGVRARRVWLRGRGNGRTLLVLDHSRERGALDGGPQPGTEFEGEYALYPDGRRAVEVVTGPPAPAPAPPGSTVAEALDAHAVRLAENPWLYTAPAVLADVVPARRGEHWYLADPAGDALPLAMVDPLRFLSTTGAHPATVAGEWSPDKRFAPMAAWLGGHRAVAL